MKLDNLRGNTLQILGRILAAEQDDEFFHDTIAELLMKIKLTYGDLAELEAENIELKRIDLLKQSKENELRSMPQNGGQYPKIRSQVSVEMMALINEVEFLDEQYREQQTETRRKERLIEEQIIERKRNRA